MLFGLSQHVLLFPSSVLYTDLKSAQILSLNSMSLESFKKKLKYILNPFGAFTKAIMLSNVDYSETTYSTSCNDNYLLLLMKYQIKRSPKETYTKARRQGITSNFK